MRYNDSEISYENLTKIEKLAYFFAVLGPETSAPLLKQFDEERVEEICREMSKIHIIPQEIRVKILKEFSSLLETRMSDTINDASLIKKMLVLAQGEDRASTTWVNAFQDPLCIQLSRWIEKLEPVKIFDNLKHEQPPTIALILACIPPKQATSILTLFSPEQQEVILINMGTLRPIPPQRMNEIVHTFMQSCAFESKDTIQKLENVDAPTFACGPASVAGILNALKKKEKTALLEGLTKKDEALLKSVQKYLFTFDDLLSLKKTDLQRVVRDVDTNDLMLALKGAKPELLEAIFKAMSKRAAESLQEELENLGPVKMKDIEAARDKVVAVVRNLESTGQLVLEGSDDELMVV